MSAERLQEAQQAEAHPQQELVGRAAGNVIARDTTERTFEVPEGESWQDYGNCLGVDPDLFFPERGASTREAKEVCRGCPVKVDCLEFALVNGEKFGIWGGYSERERRRMRRQRAQAARSVTA